jgi:hypothetical protein
MLLIQKFLLNKKSKTIYPVPDECGIISYSYKIDGIEHLHHEFIHYKWEYTKTHPSYYCFKFFNLVNIKKSNGSFMASQTKYVSWSDFFAEVEGIKEDIKRKSKIHVAESNFESENMLWRCFLQTQDLSFAAIMRSLPDSFYRSVDATLSFYEQEENRKFCLDYLKRKAPHIFYAWEYFFDADINTKFCSWFHNYFHGSI